MPRAGWRLPEARVERWRALLAASLALLLVAVVGGCQWPTSIVHVTVSNAVWSNDDWVYFLREEASSGRQLWRQQPTQRSGERVLDQAAPTSVCGDGVFSFLYESVDGLGVAIECDSGTRTELLTYSGAGGRLAPFASTSFLGDVALAGGEVTGYAEVPRGCGIAIQSIVGGKLADIDPVVTLNGQAVKVSGGDHACEAVAWIQSPAIADGRLFFLVASNSVGRLPVMTSDVLAGFTWQLVQWDPASSVVSPVAEVPGNADLAASGRGVIAAVHSGNKESGVWLVDVVSGEMAKIVDGEEAYHPGSSPDGKSFVYVEDLRRLKFGSLPAVA